MCITTVALNQAVLFTTLQHLYVLPLVTFREFRLAYETYRTRILFFRKIRMYANVGLFYCSVRVSSSHDTDKLKYVVLTIFAARLHLAMLHSAALAVVRCLAGRLSHSYIVSKRLKIRPWLLWNANKRPYPNFRMVFDPSLPDHWDS